MKTSTPGRLLFLTYTHNVWGGIEKWLHDLTGHLPDRGWEVRVGLAKGRRFNNPAAYLAHHAHIQPIVMDASPGTEEARVEAIAAACRAFQPDIVIPVGLASVFAAIRRVKKEGQACRLLIPIHTSSPNVLQNVVDQMDCVDQVVSVSRLIRDFLWLKLPQDRSRIHYIRHGVRPPIQKRPEYHGPLRLGYLGRLVSPSKRVMDLVLLCQSLIHRRQEFSLHICGSGPEEEALKEEVAKLQQQKGKVIFYGYLSAEEMYMRIYPQLDCLLMFSDWGEASPLVLFEAMHHGVVPVVSRFLGHAAEGLVKSGVNGFTFPVGDLEAAAERLCLLASNSEQLHSMSRRAKEEVTEDTEERLIRDWELIFAHSLKEGPRKPRPISSASNEDPVRGAGRLERMGFSPHLADTIRRITGKSFPHPDGWGEWPATIPVSDVAKQSVEDTMASIEAEAACSLYGK